MPAPIGRPVLSSSRYSPIAFLPTLWPVRPILKTRFQIVMAMLSSTPRAMSRPPTTARPGSKSPVEVTLPNSSVVKLSDAATASMMMPMTTGISPIRVMAKSMR